MIVGTRDRSERLCTAENLPLVAARGVERELEEMALMGKRNLDAACSINRLAIDCIQRCAERQTEVWEKFSTNALCMIGLFSAQTGNNLPSFQGSPEIGDIIDLVLGHMRDVSELIARSNQDALEVISNRSEACYRELEEAARRNISTLLEFGGQSASPADGAAARLAKPPGQSRER